MPTYEYMTDWGEIVEDFRPISRMVPVGKVTEVELADGVKVPATRIIASAPEGRGDPWKPYVSSRLPRNLEGVPCTPSGKPIISTRAQERDIMSKFGYERE